MNDTITPQEASPPKRYQVDLNGDLNRKVRAAAAAMGMTTPEYVEYRLTPIAEADLRNAVLGDSGPSK